MRIITVSREFGSGGRELGKRLADALGVPCYDQQTIDMIAQKKNVDRNYVAHASEKDILLLYPSTIGKHIIAPNYVGLQSVQIMAAQKKLIEELAAQGDCVIVGRCADLILKDEHPLNIFCVCRSGVEGRPLHGARRQVRKAVADAARAKNERHRQQQSLAPGAVHQQPLGQQRELSSVRQHQRKRDQSTHSRAGRLCKRLVRCKITGGNHVRFKKKNTY